MNDLQVILDEQQVAKENAKQLLEAFGAPFEEAGVILANYKEIKVTSEDDFVKMAEARDKRLALKKVRTGVENKRKELKADIVRAGKAIDSVARFVKDTIEPVEEYLELQEKFAEIKAAERAAAVKAERLEKLAKYTDDITLYNFEAMTDDQFANLISSLKAQKEAEIAATKQAEADRIAAEEAEKKRQAEIEAENVRLKAEAEAKEKAAEAERKKLAEEQAKRDAAIAAERDKLEAENEKRLAEERAKAEAERQKREALEAKQRAEAEAAAAVQRQTEAAERQALLAPDKEKIVAYANALNVLRSQQPTVKSQEANNLLKDIDGAIAGFIERIMQKASML